MVNRMIDLVTVSGNGRRQIQQDIAVPLGCCLRSRAESQLLAETAVTLGAAAVPAEKQQVLACLGWTYVFTGGGHRIFGP